MTKVLALVVLLFFVLLADLILAWPIMLAWNCVVPLLTKLPEIGFWQAFSMIFLLSVVRTQIKN